MRTFVFALALAACSHEDPAPPPAPAPAPPVAAAPVQKLSSDFGSCELDGEKIVPDKKPVVTKYWAGDEESTVLSVNCIGKTARLSFSAAPGTAAPFGPHIYKLDGGRGDLVVFARAKDKQLAAVSGTIEVTAFDGHHLAGTAEISGTAGAAKLTLSGGFDFPCRGRTCASP
jgi:hypothetical protein